MHSQTNAGEGQGILPKGSSPCFKAGMGVSHHSLVSSLSGHNFWAFPLIAGGSIIQTRTAWGLDLRFQTRNLFSGVTYDASKICVRSTPYEQQR